MNEILKRHFKENNNMEVINHANFAAAATANEDNKQCVTLEQVEDIQSKDIR